MTKPSWNNMAITQRVKTFTITLIISFYIHIYSIYVFHIKIYSARIFPRKNVFINV